MVESGTAPAIARSLLIAASRQVGPEYDPRGIWGISRPAQQDIRRVGKLLAADSSEEARKALELLDVFWSELGEGYLSGRAEKALAEAISLLSTAAGAG